MFLLKYQEKYAIDLTQRNRKERSQVKLLKTWPKHHSYSLNCGSHQRQPFIAGIYLLMAMDTVILPGKRGRFCIFFFLMSFDSLVWKTWLFHQYSIKLLSLFAFIGPGKITQLIQVCSPTTVQFLLLLSMFIFQTSWITYIGILVLKLNIYIFWCEVIYTYQKFWHPFIVHRQVIRWWSGPLYR